MSGIHKQDNSYTTKEQLELKRYGKGIHIIDTKTIDIDAKPGKDRIQRIKGYEPDNINGHKILTG